MTYGLAFVDLEQDSHQPLDNPLAPMLRLMQSGLPLGVHLEDERLERSGAKPGWRCWLAFLMQRPT